MTMWASADTQVLVACECLKRSFVGVDDDDWRCICHGSYASRHWHAASMSSPLYLMRSIAAAEGKEMEMERGETVAVVADVAVAIWVAHT